MQGYFDTSSFPKFYVLAFLIKQYVVYLFNLRCYFIFELDYQLYLTEEVSRTWLNLLCFGCAILRAV